jgi:hypothetical protein
MPPPSLPAPRRKSEAPPPPSLDELIASRERMLTDYQDAAYAARYRDLINRVRAAECKLGSTALTEAVARNLHKLMAIKDEYEVARLYSEGDFRRKLDEVFDGDYSLRIHLAPPLLARPDPKTGKISKLSFGPWMFTAFKWLAKARRWRGTPGMYSAAATSAASSANFWPITKPTSLPCYPVYRLPRWTMRWRWRNCPTPSAASAMSGGEHRRRGAKREALRKQLGLN